MDEWKRIFDKFDIESDGIADGKIPVRKFSLVFTYRISHEILDIFWRNFLQFDLYAGQKKHNFKTAVFVALKLADMMNVSFLKNKRKSEFWTIF
jgi:hypothetical protein